MHFFHILSKKRWSDFNEYEGELEGSVGDVKLTAYVCMDSEEDWERHAIGETVRVALRLECGTASLADPESPAQLKRLDGVNYELVGTVESAQGDIVSVRSALLLEVDLDSTPHKPHPIPGIKPGDAVRAHGVLKLSFDPT